MQPIPKSASNAPLRIPAATIRLLAAIGIAGPLLFAAAVLFQDIVQYDHLVANGDDPWTTSPVSVNALGPYGWIQILNFGVLGVSVMALAVAAHRGIQGAGRSVVGPAFLGLWGVAFLISMFPIERQPQTFSGQAHAIAFLLASLVLIPMYLFMWRRMRRSPGWGRFGRYTLAMGVLTLPFEIVSIALQQVVPFSWFYSGWGPSSCGAPCSACGCGRRHPPRATRDRAGKARAILRPLSSASWRGLQ